MQQEHYKPEFHDSFSGLKGVRRLGANYVWLLYSAFFFIEPFFKNSWVYWGKCFAVYAVFLPLYIWYVETKRPETRLPIVIAIYAIGICMTPWNEGATFFCIFAGALVPFACRTLRGALLLMLAGCVGIGAEWAFYRTNSINYLSAVMFLLVVGLANLFVAEQKRAQCRLEKAREENAALAQVAERERIARDLHDVLGHTLSVIVLKAELAGRLMGMDNARAAAEMAEVEKIARTALAEVREAIGGYRTKGLQAEVDQARRTLDAAGVVLECDSRPPQLGASEETVLSLAVREAVTNIVRHAHATRCTMNFAETADGFRALTVADDGRGASSGEGNGLRGMRERVQALGGRFRVESGVGTRVVIELPTVQGNR